jgi:hypothetical protein
MSYLWLIKQVNTLNNQMFDAVPQRYSDRKKFLWDCLCLLYSEGLTEIEKERILQSEYYPCLKKLFPGIKISSALLSVSILSFSHPRLKHVKYWDCRSNKTAKCDL